MNILKLTMAGLLGAVSVAALSQAQTVETMVPARPGAVIAGHGSEPRSTKSGHIVSAEINGTIAPSLPSPGLRPDATSGDYLRAARNSLAAGHTGEAQQSLEMAETRSLGGSDTPSQIEQPSTNAKVAEIRDALHALGEGDRTQAMQIVDTALVRGWP